MKNVSRRMFLAGSGAAALGTISTLGVGAAGAAEVCKMPKKWDHTYDVIVIGAGGAGMAAGITAAEAGARTVVLEKLGFPGGNTMVSGGGMNGYVKADAEAARGASGAKPHAVLAIAAGDNPERIPSEASFASICGVSPIPASSGKTDRHRLNRGGNRQANKALHMIAVSRMSGDERTLAYMAKRKSDGKTKREAMRCLKRFIAREVYSTLRHPMRLKYARGEELAAMRKSLSLTQQQIARELNVPNVRLSEIERDVCPHEEIRREYDRYLNAKMSASKGLDSP